MKKVLIPFTFFFILFLAYIAVYLYKCFLLSEVTQPPEDIKSLEACTDLIRQIGSEYNVPKSVLSPKEKTIYCVNDINLLFTKYREVTIYGVNDPSAQVQIYKLLSNNGGLAKPIKLTVYESENWLPVGTYGHKRGPEKIVFQKWIE